MNDGRDTDGARRDYLMLGEVVANQDPEGLGRVRVQVPGILEPYSKWAFPIGRMFGVLNGIHWVPEVGSNVCVFFNQGDQDHPYYIPGPPGAPGGQSDIPEQAPAGSVDHLVVRWRNFYVTFNGKTGEERVTFKDLGSGTQIDVERATGKYTRDVEGPEQINVKQNRDVTVEQGDETHTIALGKRTTQILGDDAKTITAGNKVDSLLVGNETKTLAAGSSTETIAQNKSVTTGLAINLTSLGGAINVSAPTGVITLSGAGISIQSTGATAGGSTGLVTNTFLGGKTENVLGTLAFIVTTLIALTAPTIQFLSGIILLGTGPLYKKLVHRDVFSLWANAHTHTAPAGGGVTSAPIEKVLPGGTPPNVDEATVTTQFVQGS